MEFLSVAIVMLVAGLILSPICALAVMWGDRKTDGQTRKG